MMSSDELTTKLRLIFFFFFSPCRSSPSALPSQRPPWPARFPAPRPPYSLWSNWSPAVALDWRGHDLCRNTLSFPCLRLPLLLWRPRAQCWQRPFPPANWTQAWRWSGPSLRERARSRLTEAVGGSAGVFNHVGADGLSKRFVGLDLLCTGTTSELVQNFVNTLVPNRNWSQSVRPAMFQLIILNDFMFLFYSKINKVL